MTIAYELRCRECGKTYGLQPLSICDECFSPLEVAYDLEYARTRFTREAISNGPLNMWRYAPILPARSSPPSRAKYDPPDALKFFSSTASVVSGACAAAGTANV